MTARRGRLLAVVTSVAVVLTAGALALRGGTEDAVAPDSAPAAVTADPAPTAADPAPTAQDADVPPVIVPGRPGEEAAERDAAEVRDDSSPRYNSLDTWFVRMMISHHQQALEMAGLATDRAAAAQVRALAERIRASQGPEIGVLRAWLTARGLAGEVDGHDHTTMRGMHSPEAMRRLADARGADFDRLFLQMMTEHHEGAVVMATDVLKVGLDLTVEQFATSVATEQAVEIARMRDILPT
ncbi:DUF305 domain-containing protein [Micromonospora sp. Llam7]|uniref:DUF305 domain-containing protein n=1 Tax=Micromonospora tarapacensis TaxID=2835305 RepID=UPI001C83DAFC|nr:DUF305 domain-containing protein [Micromonospora tarapacensis]MBX7266644.1 DUF305 domain-containing protein [Micromonospora tarapacensis]